MHTLTRTTFTTVKTEGAILPADLLQRIADGRGLDGLRPEDYHLAPTERLNEAINRAWNRCLGVWQSFDEQRSRLPETDTGATLTRERWLLILFQELGYGRLPFQGKLTATPASPGGGAEEPVDYPISHRWEHVPIHLVTFRQDLDRRDPTAKRSPHSLVQEYLNRAAGSLWGFASNGLRLRILRDNASLTRAAYVEFDLEAMLTGEHYADFALLWLTCHQSRVEVGAAVPPSPAPCWLERWSQTAAAQGARALDALRDGVQEAIEALGRGFLAHPANTALRAALQTGALSTLDYYRQLLRLVYRLIILFVAEDRDLLCPPQTPPDARRRYDAAYSLGRLRDTAARLRGSPHPDLYRGLRLLFKLLRRGYPDLGVPALGGFLFSPAATPALDAADLANTALLNAIRALTFTVEGNVRRPVDYNNLDSEELGSVYESLLELHPQIHVAAATFALAITTGSERKTTGAHYTATPLVNQLLDSALEPVIAARLAQAGGKQGDKETRRRGGAPLSTSPLVYLSPEAALLSIRVLDYASGSGHILIGAARRLARHLARIRTGDAEPSPADLRAALRDVVRHCIYGVDINPMAVELCKVALWLETLEPGKPLSFLDHHIQCGNSLVGTGLTAQGAEARGQRAGQAQDALDLPAEAPAQWLIPDEAFAPVAGDDKAAAAFLRKLNRTERGMNAPLIILQTPADLARWQQTRTAALAAMPEDSAEQVAGKATAYAQSLAAPAYRQEKLTHDLWAAAFFWPLAAGAGTAAAPAPTHGQLIRARAGQPLDPALTAPIAALADRVPYFHWALAFPEVFAAGGPSTDSGHGFDCVLSNPPWEMLQLEELQFFAARDPQIAELAGNERKKAIATLQQSNPQLAQEFADAQHTADATSKFLRSSSRFPLTAVGKMNTYALFAELSRTLLAPTGRAGIIVPTGIATDDTTKAFFGDLVEKRALASLYDFENREAIFPGVHRSYKFSLVTLSSQPVAQSQFVFFATRVEHLADPRRRFTLAPENFALINPNTRTCPIFRTRADAELTAKIYRHVPVLENERTKVSPWDISFKQGLFNMTSDSGLFRTAPGDGLLPLYEAKMIWQYDHRSGSYEGRSERGFTNLGETPTPRYQDPLWRPTSYYWVSEETVDERITDVEPMLLAFYRAGNERDAAQILYDWIAGYHINNGRWDQGHAMIVRQLNPLFPGTMDLLTSSLGAQNFERRYPLTERDISIIQDPKHTTILSIIGALIEARTPKWLIGFRDVTNATNERTAIFSMLPKVGVGHTAPLAFVSHTIRTTTTVCLLANVNSLAFDYVARQKIGGMHLTYSFLKQLPALPPTAYFPTDIAFIAPRVLELVYTAWDIKAFADDLWRDAATDLTGLTGLIQQQWDANRAATGGHPWDPPAWAAIAPDGCPLPPFKWDDDRRALLRAELDAYYARLYGLTRDELRYILDPKDIHGPDFPGETFRVLKEKEERALGEYRTRRLVLAAWDRLAAELGPVVVRNYRAELNAPKGFGNPSGLAAIAEPGPTYQIAAPPPKFGAIQAPAPDARPVPAPRPEPDLFSESKSERTSVPPPGRPTPTNAPASPQGDARPPAPQPRFQSPNPPPRPEPAAPPLVVPVMPAPQGAYPTRLAQVMALRKQTTPEAIGVLVAALGDPDANIRWLAALTLQGIGGGTVIATLRAFIEQAPSALAQEEAERVLGKLTD